LRATEETAAWTVKKINALRQLQQAAADHARASAPKIYTRELLDVVFERPYCRISDLTERGIARRQTASVYLKELARIGLLAEKPVGREKLFINPKLMQLLTREANDFTPY
jgi:Fic family protein